MIRLARLDDAPAMAETQLTAYRETYSGQWPESYLAGLNPGVLQADWARRLSSQAPKKIYLVAENSSGMLGFASGGKVSESDLGFASELYSLYVLKKAQRQGLGRKLFHGVTCFLAKQQYQTMLCWVHSTNMPAQAFYEAMGGQKTREKMSSRIEGMLMYAYGWNNLEQVGA